MAYSCNGYNCDQSNYLGENYQIPYGVNYDIVPFQALGDDCRNEFSNQNLVEYEYEYEYEATPNYGAYEYDPPGPVNIGSVVAYSVSPCFSEPKSYVYDVYSEAATQFRISYSVQEYNELEFEEYDPTPYGGGYDLAVTYGKPLPPSPVTCYPLSSPTPDPSASAALPPKENVGEPTDGAKPQPQPHIESIPTTLAVGDNKQELQPSSGNERNKEDDIEDASDSSSESDKSTTPRIEGEGSDSELIEKRVMPHIPSGYGLEAMDLCESLFGYWPCLARYNKGLHDYETANYESSSSCNQWKETADYLFGSSYPYGETTTYDDAFYSYH